MTSGGTGRWAQPRQTRCAGCPASHRRGRERRNEGRRVPAAGDGDVSAAGKGAPYSAEEGEETPARIQQGRRKREASAGRTHDRPGLGKQSWRSRFSMGSIARSAGQHPHTSPRLPACQGRQRRQPRSHAERCPRHASTAPSGLPGETSAGVGSFRTSRSSHGS